MFLLETEPFLTLIYYHNSNSKLVNGIGNALGSCTQTLPSPRHYCAGVFIATGALVSTNQKKESTWPVMMVVLCFDHSG